MALVFRQLARHFYGTASARD